MLFNSPEFLFAFLPATLGIVLVTWRLFGRRPAVLVLIAASLFFYGYWKIWGLAVITGSIALNLAFTGLIERTRDLRFPHLCKIVLAAGIATNLGILAYFKYMNFFVATIAGLAGLHPAALDVVLPIGLSFYTFQQIAFLADTYLKRIGPVTPPEYIASVLFFPHLIAGPLVNYREIIGQFRTRLTVSTTTVWAGFPIFMIGLTKKVFIADNIGVIISPIFAKASVGPLDPVAASLAALGYTAQLYFDFSGYSDMAIGLGFMFGIVLPINFLSPYKATSIIDFWRRWHITLSAFLRDYLYIPLGGNRRGRGRRYLNLLIVMVLGGLWHGAAFTFVAWGALHGIYLLVNHFWRGTIDRFIPIPTLLSAPLTFLCVVAAWVLFRSPDFQTAVNMFKSMSRPIELPGMIAYLLGIASPFPWLRFSDDAVAFVDLLTGVALILGALTIAWIAPNTATLFDLQKRQHDAAPLRHGVAMACWTGLLVWLCLFSLIGAAPSQFLYFQF